MKKKLIASLLIAILVLSACSSKNEDNDEQANEQDDQVELIALEVEFPVPEHVEVGETVELKAIVTYGEEKVTDADEVIFEYWLLGDKENSINVEATNNGDGTYTAEVIFEEDGIYEMFAHTTARGQHNMPLKAIAVGNASLDDYEAGSDSEEDHSHH